MWACRVPRATAWARQPAWCTRRAQEVSAGTLLVLVILLLVACGQDVKASHKSGATDGSHQALARRKGTTARSSLVRGVAETIDLLRKPPRLNRADLALIQRTLPTTLPFLPASTAEIPAPGLIGRYWVAPGVVGVARSPGVCLYAQMPRARAINVSCFDIATVTSGRAVMLFWFSGGADVIGIVPSHKARIEIFGHHALRRVRATRNVYAVHVSFRPSRMIVLGPNGKAEIKLSGGPPKPP